MKIRASPNLSGVCPECGGETIPKCGEIKIWHWAHKSLKDTNCDYCNKETKWHYDWKLYSIPDKTEVIFQRDEMIKRADIVGKNDIVIELQSKAIDTRAGIEREKFYNSVCDGMIWLFNGGKFLHISITDKVDYITFRWMWAWKSLEYLNCPVFIECDRFLYSSRNRYFIRDIDIKDILVSYYTDNGMGMYAQHHFYKVINAREYLNDYMKKRHLHGVYINKNNTIMSIDRYFLNENSLFKYFIRNGVLVKQKSYNNTILEIRNIYFDDERPGTGGWGYLRTKEWFINKYIQTGE